MSFPQASGGGICSLGSAGGPICGHPSMPHAPGSDAGGSGSIGSVGFMGPSDAHYI